MFDVIIKDSEGKVIVDEQTNDIVTAFVTTESMKTFLSSDNASVLLVALLAELQGNGMDVMNAIQVWIENKDEIEALRCTVVEHGRG